MKININNTKADSEKALAEQRMRVLLLLPGLLVFFGVSALLLFLGFHVSVDWAMASNDKSKLIFGLYGILIIGVELILAFLFLKLTRWALNNIKPRSVLEPDKDNS